MSEEMNTNEIDSTETTDTEGHGFKMRPEASKVEEADTEGHGVRFKP